MCLQECNCMRAAGLINNGKFNYGAFNGIPKYKQDVLIAPYKVFLRKKRLQVHILQ